MQINFLTQPLNINPPKSDNNFPETEFVKKPDSDIVQTKAKTKPLESAPFQDENLKNLQNTLAEHNITLKFREDEKTKQLVVELVDNKTGESIRQFPSEVSLKLSAMAIKVQGQFVDDKG